MAKNNSKELGNKENVGIVFIHGAGFNAALWDKVIGSIDVQSIAVNFPNRDKKISNVNVLFDDYIKEVKRQITGAKFKRYILVCHSIGGVVGLALARELGKKVAGFIAVAASIPAVNQSFISTLPLPNRLIMGLMVRLLGTRPPDAAIKSSLCNDLSETDAQNILDNFVPEAKGLYFEKIKQIEIDCPTLYIKTLNDKEFSQDLQQRMIHNLNTKNVVSIDSGHLPMLSKPQELVEIINTFFRKNNLYEQI